MSHEPMDADLPRCPHGNEATCECALETWIVSTLGDGEIVEAVSSILSAD